MELNNAFASERAKIMNFKFLAQMNKPGKDSIPRLFFLLSLVLISRIKIAAVETGGGKHPIIWNLYIISNIGPKVTGFSFKK